MSNNIATQVADDVLARARAIHVAAGPSSDCGKMLAACIAERAPLYRGAGPAPGELEASK